MATAIYAKTESTDEYLYCVIGTLSKAEVQDLLKDELGDEYEYIAYFDVAYSASEGQA